MFFQFLILLLFGFVLSACTSRIENLPEISKYETDTELMINICNKFVNDSGDVKKLHSAAVATQSARVISCFNYNGECNLYGECLNIVIASTKEDTISFEDRQKMVSKLEELKKSIQDGKAKLHQEFKKRANQ